MPYYKKQHYFAENLVHPAFSKKHRCLIFDFTNLGEFNLKIIQCPEGYYELHVTTPNGVEERHVIYTPTDVENELESYADLLNLNYDSPVYHALVVALNYLED